MTNDGSTDLWQLRDFGQDDFIRIHVPGNFNRSKVRPSLKSVRLVLNLVTDPELNPNVLRYADEFLKPFDMKILNQPRHVLSSGRDGIARLLADIDGLIVPRVARFRGHPGLAVGAVGKTGITFPAILRETGTHSGRVIGIVANIDEMLGCVDPKTYYFLTKFVDSRDANGLYHKIRVFFFGSNALIRHRLISEHWNVHAPDRHRVLVHDQLSITRERALIEGGVASLPASVRTILQEIRARMKLDYFGVDFALMPDGKVLLFEANATMNFFALDQRPPFDYFGQTLETAQDMFGAMLAANAPVAGHVR